MQSLRSRKSESQTKVQRSPSKLIRQNGRSTTRVDEKMKRRMSMRYAEISSPTDALVPAVPALPIGLQPISPSGIIHEGIPEVETPREDPRLAELRLLDKDDFDPDACADSFTTRWMLVDISRNRSQAEDGKLNRSTAEDYAVVAAISEGRSG